LAANHTGWAGLDYWNLFITVYDDARRAPRVAVHPSYFRFRKMREMADALGFFEVSVATSTEILDAGGLVTFFPEAEEGNFKPIWKRYRLQPFKPGFARVALATEAPIVPVVIVGGEEANPSLGRMRPLEDVLDAPVPIPVNLLPFPVKWRIAFLDPIHPSAYLERESPDKDVAEVIARDLRHLMQDALDEQVEKRGHPIL
jgi:1-acyl-sn-glycerol-3-phosphate acyltransferase